MNNKNNNNLKSFFQKNGFSVAICGTIAILLIATLYFSYASFESSEQERLAQAEDEYQAVDSNMARSFTETETESTSDLKESENSTEATTDGKTAEKTEESTDADNSNTSSEKETEEQEESNSEQAQVFSLFDEGQEMTWPVFGQIVMDYSTETAIYDKTLELYRTNDSICIAAEVGTDVLAATEGVVEEVYTDSQTGRTVVINHGNGWLSTYSQLQSEVNVAVGQVVKEGQVIGKIASPTNASILLGPHLNFKITKDDDSTDPKVVLAQIEE